MTDRWMTYAEAAAALGMTPDSIRARARREHWRKQLGNDGRAQVLVPGDAGGIPTGIQECDPPASRPVKRPEPTLIEVLQARLSDLEARAIELRAEVERERTERIQERERNNHLADEVACLARQLAGTVEEALKREQALQSANVTKVSRIAELETEIATMKSRPWWRRLVG